MNKLEVGMYVRYKTLSNQIKIAKIIEIDKKILDLDNKDCTTEKYIIGEPSYSIIDLIEVGDIVNGIYVDEITNDDTFDDRKHFRLLHFICYFSEEDIKSIVTKEQFEQMKYKVN